MNARHAYILGFSTALPVIALDQLSKHWLLALLDFDCRGACHGGFPAGVA